MIGIELESETSVIFIRLPADSSLSDSLMWLFLCIVTACRVECTLRHQLVLVLSMTSVGRVT
jgi:hypothetical protein